MTKPIQFSALIAVIALSAGWAGWNLYGHRPTRPVSGSFHRSKVDAPGTRRGIVQVDLMRQIMADKPVRPPRPIVAGIKR